MKIIDLYADFETTKAIYNQDYENFYDAFKNNEVHKLPMIYSWCISYEITNQKYEKIFTLNDTKKDSYKWVIRDNILFIYGISLFSFIEFITSIKIRCNIWFHNGSKFDFHFIIPALIKYGYLYIPTFDNLNSFLNENEKLKLRYDYLNDVSLKLNKKVWDKLNEFEFNTITDGTKKIYKVQLVSKEKHYDNKKLKYDNVLINLRDSNLLFMGSLKSYGEKLNQIFKTSKYTKKDLNYDREQPYNNIDELEQDKQEFEYLLQDTLILLKFLKVMGDKKELPRTQWKTTAASTAYSQWELQFGKSYFKKHILNSKNVKEIKNKFKLYYSHISKKWLPENKWKKEKIRSILPINWLNEKLGDEILGHTIHKLYYNGGMSMVNEKYRGMFLKNVNGFDINSSYPSVMNSNNLCPIGLPIFDIKEVNFNYYQLLELEILRPIENKYGIPFFVNFRINEDKEKKTKQYLRYLKPNMKTYIDSNEFKRFLKYYSNNYKDFKVNVFLSFKATTMKEIFGEFVDKWYKIKQNSNDELSKIISKLMLNSLYGKFGTKIIRERKEWDEINFDWKSFEIIENSKFYLPIATAITSLARCKIIDAVDTNYNDFYYCDTDSIYLNSNNIFIKNISPNLGDWKLENTIPMSGVFRRPKQYLLRNNKDKDKMVYAGINFGKVNQNWVKSIGYKDFVFGLTIPNQIRSYKFFGTVILEPISKEIKPLWLYFPTKEQIYTNKKDFIELWKEFELNQNFQSSIIREKRSKKKFTTISNKSQLIKFNFI